MKNAFDGFINRLDKSKERISEPEDIIESSKTKKQKTKTEKNRIPKDYGTTTKGVLCVLEIPEREERKRETEIL